MGRSRREWSLITDSCRVSATPGWSGLGRRSRRARVGRWGSGGLIEEPGVRSVITVGEGMPCHPGPRPPGCPSPPGVLRSGPNTRSIPSDRGGTPGGWSSGRERSPGPPFRAPGTRLVGRRRRWLDEPGPGSSRPTSPSANRGRDDRESGVGGQASGTDCGLDLETGQRRTSLRRSWPVGRGPPRTGGAGGSPNRGEWGDESEVGAVIVRAYAAPSIRSQWARGAAAREAAGPILEEWARRSLMFHVKH